MPVRVTFIVAAAVFVCGCNVKPPAPPVTEPSTIVTISFDDFVGTTAEAGNPDAERHPFAPASSRAAGDAFVHYIEQSKTQADVLRFWYPEAPDGRVMPVDYEILQT